MSVFRSIVFSAVVSGLIAGSAVTVAQQFTTVPLILKAETYEHDEAGSDANSGAKPEVVAPTASAPDIAGHDHATRRHEAPQPAAHQHDAAAWKPAEGLPRHAFTAAANVLTAIGFALLLAG